MPTVSFTETAPIAVLPVASVTREPAPKEDPGERAGRLPLSRGPRRVAGGVGAGGAALPRGGIVASRWLSGCGSLFRDSAGYLITALLLAEWSANGRIALGAFWLRRARRLLPALYAVIVATLAYAVLFAPDELARLRGIALAAVLYGTNWYLIFAQQSYFEAIGRPSPLRHLWSLAVEEQFYLLWPPLLAAVVWLFRRRGVLLVTLAGAITSAVLMADAYTPQADPSRLYYGTDTRLTGLLLGAALACVWVPWHLPLSPQWGQRTARAFEVLGVIACIVLVVCFVRFSEVTPTLYRGGFALVGLATTALIAALAHPRTRLGSVFGWVLLRWLGTRSYGVYLWHWPVFMFTRPQLDMPLDGFAALAPGASA